MARLTNSAASTKRTAGEKRERTQRTAAAPERNNKSRRERTPVAAAATPRAERAPRTSGKKRSGELSLTITMRRAKETKNKWAYIELDSEGDAVENPFGGECKIGQIYVHKDELPDPAPKTITLTITVD